MTSLSLTSIPDLDGTAASRGQQLPTPTGNEQRQDSGPVVALRLSYTLTMITHSMADGTPESLPGEVLYCVAKRPSQAIPSRSSERKDGGHLSCVISSSSMRSQQRPRRPSL
jgi:hypothetical protein